MFLYNDDEGENDEKGYFSHSIRLFGAGKGTVMKSFMEKYSDKFCLSVSATTRLPREGEIHGQDYFFKKKEEFETDDCGGCTA